jgi:hypothetical protein
VVVLAPDDCGETRLGRACRVLLHIPEWSPAFTPEQGPHCSISSDTPGWVSDERAGGWRQVVAAKARSQRLVTAWSGRA